MKVRDGMMAAALAMALGVGSAIGEDAVFLKAPRHVGPPAALHSVTNRAFQGIPSMAVSPGGRLWATWYAGVTPGEDHNNYVVLSTSGDGGRTWREVMIVDPDEDGVLRTFDPELWTDPDGRLWWIWAQAITHGEDAQTWALVADDPDRENASWSAPRVLAPGVMMCKPIVLRDGTWAFPISDWEGRRLKTPEAATAGLWASTDKGKSVQFRGAALSPVEHRNFDEHMFIERRDGSIWSLVRTRYGIGESVSTDGGRTWSELVPSAIPHPTARFFIKRLQSGALLLVKHGPMTERSGRSHLMAFISTDDGAAWGGGLLLDERTGVSYPDGQQAADGTIHVIYDYSRTGDRHILMASFREADAAAGNAVSGAVRLNQLISEGSGGREKPRPPAATPRDNKDGEALRREPAGALATEPYSLHAMEAGAKLFSDRTYKASGTPGGLGPAMFLRTPMDGEKTVTCVRAGMIYVLTPQPDRNGDSQSAALEKFGFRKAAVPEIPLFDPSSPRNLCSLYQKACVEGEIIPFGKWAVPVFRVQ